MIKTLFLSSIRNLWKNRVTSAINILALTLGLSSILFLYVQRRYEGNFDTHQPKADQIYRVNLTQAYPNRTVKTGNSQSMLIKAIRNEYPELESAFQVIGPKGGLVTVNPNTSEEKIFEERFNVFYADSVFLKYMDYDFIAGNMRTALDDPNSVVLSKRVANKYFPELEGRELDVIGKQLNYVDSLTVYVTGVVDSPPSNSNFPFQLLFSSEVYYKRNGWDRDNWYNVAQGMTFMVLGKGQDPTQYEERFPELVSKYRTEEEAEIVSYSLLNLKELHGAPEWGFSGNYAENEAMKIGFTAVGLFILLSACINFINIQMAQVLTRSKEVGVRKVLGGTKTQLVVQFLVETLILTTVSFFMALWITELALRGWNGLLTIVRMDMQLDVSVIYFGFALITGVSLLSGIYPALKLSSFNPSESLKSGFSALTGKMEGLNVRQVLVITQFIITQILIICTIVIASQMDYFVNKDMGFNKDEMVTIQTYSPSPQQVDLLINEIESMPEVEEFTFSSGPPIDFTSRYNTSFIEVGHEDKGDLETRNKFIDHRYLDIYDIELLAGRNFRREEYNDTIDAFIVNETFARQLEVSTPEEAINKRIRCYGVEARIVGITKDFHVDGLSEEIKPLIMFPLQSRVNRADLRISTQNLQPALAKLREVWLNTFPSRSFQFETLDDYILESYIVENIMMKSIRIFSIVAILIGCLGLYALVSFMSIKRTKEIGIRKVLGATYGQILYIFSRRFFILTLVAFVISAPLAYKAMQLWLSNYAYRVPLDWKVFTLGFVVTVLLTLITVSSISLKTAKTNPADTLQFE
ncbi:MAG: ABC transporter permease [Ekhidna sp.]|nr:ABC transporter permease [Ekhidna sp.]